jgi:hypothetical protein
MSNDKKFVAAPSMEWLVKGEKDSFAHYLQRPREDLPCSDMSDDTLANYAFMYYNRPLGEEHDILLGRAEGHHPKIAFMTATKERMRWLARRVAVLEGNYPEVDIPYDIAAKVAKQERRLMTEYENLFSGLCTAMGTDKGFTSNVGARKAGKELAKLGVDERLIHKGLCVYMHLGNYTLTEWSQTYTEAMSNLRELVAAYEKLSGVTVVPTQRYILTDMHGARGVVCEVIPDDQMPEPGAYDKPVAEIIHLGRRAAEVTYTDTGGNKVSSHPFVVEANRSLDAAKATFDKAGISIPFHVSKEEGLVFFNVNGHLTAEELEALVYLARNSELKGDSGSLWTSDHVIVPNERRALSRLNQFATGDEYEQRRAHLRWSQDVLGIYMALGLEHAKVTQRFVVDKIACIVKVPEDDIRTALGFDNGTDMVKRLAVFTELCKHLTAAGKVIPTREHYDIGVPFFATGGRSKVTPSSPSPFLQEGMFNSTHDILGNPLPVFLASEQNGAGGVAQKNLSVLRDLNDREFSELFTRVMQRNITGEEAKLYGHFSTADFCNVASDRLNRES